MAERRVIVYIAMSLDGYIAKPGDDLRFLEVVQMEGEDYGYGEFIASVDTVILGRKTYDWVLTQVPEFPHADKETYVISRTRKGSVGKTTFYSGCLSELVSKLRQQKGRNIFVDGGSDVINEMMKADLIDEFVISVIPIAVGEGTRLFKDGRPEQLLKLERVKSFGSGLVQMHYTRKR